MRWLAASAPLPCRSAKILGIEMYGTSSSEEKLARVRELGLQHGINYKQWDYVDAIKNLTRRGRRRRRV